MASEFSEYDYVEAGTIEYSKLPPLDAETNRIMKAEFKTGFSLTIFYFIFIFSIPVMNWHFPDFAWSKLWGGMSVSWFITSVVAMAMAFIIAYVHTTLYEKRLKKYALTSQEGRKLG
ncbi:hypothetical protein [Bacillus massiliigorillae]|uniref:hypothetical protein n=1 Tax=Bacillus massiliigorillae TaxID=1243664 RepID=UPI0003A59737|nr:hypothetical protein [Bacillus massiliigorillae]